MSSSTVSGFVTVAFCLTKLGCKSMNRVIKVLCKLSPLPFLSLSLHSVAPFLTVCYSLTHSLARSYTHTNTHIPVCAHCVQEPVSVICSMRVMRTTPFVCFWFTALTSSVRAEQSKNNVRENYICLERNQGVTIIILTCAFSVLVK